MSHVIRASQSAGAAKVARVTEALRNSWTQARLTDRELLAMHTNLMRHVG